MNEVYRQRLYFESGKAIPQTLRDFINLLRTVQFDPEKEYHEFEIPVSASPIKSEDVRELTAFPFEFQLLERNGNIIASTGSREQPHAKEQNLDERKNTKLYLHTHPSVNTPSFSDLALTGDNGERQLVLAHPGGLMVFRRPIYNPVTQMPSLDGVREILLHYCEAKGIEISDRPKQDLRGFFDLTDREQAEFERRFAENTKMIIAETSWDKSEGLTEIMDVINLKRRIDPDFPIIPSCLDNLHLGGLNETQQKRISNLGGLIDHIRNKSGIFGEDQVAKDSFAEFLRDTLTSDLAKEGTIEAYKHCLKQLLTEVSKL